MTYSKTDNFDLNSQQLAKYFKVLSHPARVAILKYLSEQKHCISGDITSEIPLSRTTVSQHLQELKNSGLIQGTISGTKVNYCINSSSVKVAKAIINAFLTKIDIPQSTCSI